MIPTSSLFRTLLGCLPLLIPFSHFQAETISFDHLNEYEGAFQSVGGNAPAWIAKAGKGGSGGLVAGNTDYLACVNSANPLEVQPGQSVTVSMSFLYKDQAARIAQRNAGVYLTANPELSPLDTPEGAMIAVFLHNVSNTPGQEQTVVSFSTGGKAVLGDKGRAYSGSEWWDSDALRGHWCQVQVKFIKLPTAGLWELGIKIFDLGEDGFAGPAEIFSINEPEINAGALYAAPRIFAGFQNHRYDRGFRNLDDFTVTIE